MAKVAIVGLGTALPEFAVTQLRSAEIANELFVSDPQKQRLVSALYRKSGVKQRHSVLLHAGDEWNGPAQTFFEHAEDDRDLGPTTADRMIAYARTAAPLAAVAARNALNDARIEAKDITHLVTVSCSGFRAPGVDIALIRELGLSPRTARTHIGFMGCHGSLNGLRVAQSIADSNPKACVLVVAVELCSIHMHYGWEPEKIVANSLFADGSAAAIVRAVDGEHDSGVTMIGSESLWVANSEEAMTWTIGDHGFEMTLSPQVPQAIAERLNDWVRCWLAERGLAMSDIGVWAVHPGGPRILAAVEESLGLDETALSVSRKVLAECGNMSSPTLLFILQELRRRGARGLGIALGFGPGLMFEAALLRLGAPVA